VRSRDQSFSNSAFCSAASSGLPSDRPQKLTSISASSSRCGSSGSASSITTRSAASPASPAARRAIRSPTRRCDSTSAEPRMSCLSLK
jgi:hypothetical protein